MRPPPLFLARRAYRLRRLTDAARLLPVVATFLFLLPVFWQSAGTRGPSTATGGVYVFGVWAILILATALIARHLDRAQTPDGEADDTGTRHPSDLADKTAPAITPDTGGTDG